MKIFTNRFWQFALGALVAGIVFQLALGYFVDHTLVYPIIISAVLYFCIMYFIGWYFGKKDRIENSIYDIGIRWHVATFVIYNGLNYLFWYLRFYQTEMDYSQVSYSQAAANSVLKGINSVVLIWSIFIVIHIIVFFFTRHNAIKGYDKKELFE